MNPDREMERCRQLVSLADEVLASHKSAPSNFIMHPGWVDSEMFRRWRSSGLSFLEDLLGKDHSYVDEFTTSTEKGAHGTAPTREGKGVLLAVLDDLEAGYLTSIRRLIRAQVFTDFLEMADHLHEQGYHHAAVSLAGAVLEDGLRQIASAAGVKKPAADLSGLSSQLLQAEAIDPLRKKELQVWTDLRNAADHGDWDPVTEERTADMLSGVARFLADEMPKR